MTTHVPIDAALRIARRMCARADVALVMPDDPMRLAVAALVGVAHSIQGTGTDAARVRENVTVTLPGAPGAALGLLSLVPVVGGALAALASPLGRTGIFLAPAAVESGEGLLQTCWHEWGHCGDIERGGLSWCVAYLLAAEVRAGGEAPCYGLGMSVAVALGTATVDEALASARASLMRYGLDAESLALAYAILDSHAMSLRRGGDPGGVREELRAELAVEGIALP